MPEVRLNRVNAERLREAASNLRLAFSWDLSPQGREFWQTAHDNLIALAEMKEKFEEENLEVVK